MHLAEIDYLAGRGGSPWHQATAPAKMAYTAVAVGAAVAEHKVWPLLGVLALNWALLLLAGVPVRRLLHLLLIPALFAAVFAFSRSGAVLGRAAVVVLKSLSAASALVLLCHHQRPRRCSACCGLFCPPHSPTAVQDVAVRFSSWRELLGNFLTVCGSRRYNPLKLFKPAFRRGGLRVCI
jgi:hypothetical protein